VTRTGYIYNRVRYPGSTFILKAEDAHLLEDGDNHKKSSWFVEASKVSANKKAQLEYDNLDDEEIESSFED
jgi:hypothetical protein